MASPLPWRSFDTIDPRRDLYVLNISRLPLRRHARIPTMARWTVRIVRQLSKSEGLIGYSLKADLYSKTFWTMSAWKTGEALRAFVRSAAHRGAMAAIAPHMDNPVIETSTVVGRDLPLDWQTVRRRLAADEHGRTVTTGGSH